MNPVCEDIKDMLEAESLGLTFGSNLFISREPEVPDNCVTLYDIPGSVPDIGLQAESYYRDGFQIRVRNNTYTAGMAQIFSIMDNLQGRANETWNGTFYSLIRVYLPPSILEYDENGRAVLVMSVQAQRR